MASSIDNLRETVKAKRAELIGRLYTASVEMENKEHHPAVSATILTPFFIGAVLYLLVMSLFMLAVIIMDGVLAILIAPFVITYFVIDVVYITGWFFVRVFKKITKGMS